MRVFVKTLKGTNFEIQVEPQHTIADVKKNIETVQGKSVYPAEQQLLIHQGKVLKDETTLQDNQVLEDSFLVIMLSKAKASSSGVVTTKAAPANPGLREPTGHYGFYKPLYCDSSFGHAVGIK